MTGFSTRVVMVSLGLLALGVVGCDKDEEAVCGNQKIEGGESCDGSALGDQTCETLGHGGGVLACAADCTYDESGCTDASCGNGVLEAPDELCDGSELDGNDCTTIGQGFIGGELACASDCADWDVGACESSECGDNVIEGDEVCDGTDLGGNDCTTIGQGFGCGTLACDAGCGDWDTSGCVPSEGVCGDGIIDACEACDGTSFGSQTCGDYGYSHGKLSCMPDCSAVLIHRCDELPWHCGDGIAQPGESCDGADHRGFTCELIGFDSGTMVCTPECDWDVTGCMGDWCAGSGFYNDGWCDPCEFLGGTPDPDCDTVCLQADGACTSWYVANTTVSTCLWTKGVEDPDCGCGNGVLEINHFEGCEGGEFEYNDCNEYYPGFCGGTFSCLANCRIDVSSCTPCETTEVTCDDLIDNDGDALVDCDDPDCDGQACSGGVCVAGTCQ